MPRQIQDEFSKLKVSRQRRYQLRQNAKGLCRLCTAAVSPGHTLCPEHQEVARVRANEHYHETTGQSGSHLI